MDYATLCTAMGRTVPTSYVGPFNQALLAAQCTNVNRAAMFCAQTGHESGGLIWLQELASGAAYQGRADLGNTQPGFGVRYKGRGIIQLTGAYNYAAFSRWAYGRGLVPTPSYFYDNPLAVATLPWAFISASYYWTVSRPLLNAHADAGNVLQCTKDVNGGTNGYADRVARWNRAIRLGSALLPDPIYAAGGDDMAAVPQSEWDAVRDALLALIKPWPGGVSDKEPAKLEDPNVAGYNAIQYALRNNVEIHQVVRRVSSLEAKVDRLLFKLGA